MEAMRIKAECVSQILTHVESAESVIVSQTSFMRSHPYLILYASWFYGDKRQEAGKAFGC